MNANTSIMRVLLNTVQHILTIGAISAVPAAAALAEPAGTVPVTPDNYVRAQSDTYFARHEKDGGFGQFLHHRKLLPPEYRKVVRPNRDTLYSSAIFDLDAGPVTITLPDAGKRFRSIMAQNADGYVQFIAYGAGPYVLTREQLGTRYTFVVVRALVQDNADDLRAVHALQDGIVVQQASRGRLEVPAWDQESLAKVRGALTTLAETLPDMRQAFGRKGEVSPIRNLIGNAVAWGGNPDKDALYLTVTPRRNDGKTVHRLRVGNVPVDGFWSISVYNEQNFFEPNPQGAYSLNSVTAKRDADGTVAVQFGGCAGNAPNCLPVTPGWNYVVRLYLPREEVLKGTWKFPEAEHVQARAENSSPKIQLGAR